jgi:hypothetical protein
MTSPALTHAPSAAASANRLVQARYRRLDGAYLLPLVRAGVVFVDGVQQEGKVRKTRLKAACSRLSA